MTNDEIARRAEGKLDRDPEAQAEAEILGRWLPKWPQMRVSGATLTTSQAMEVIRRTDNFFLHGRGGHDKTFDLDLAARVGMPHWIFLDDDRHARMSILDIMDTEGLKDAWLSAWEAVRTAYVRNAWISTSNFHGPSGWCAPDGIVNFTHNVGKYPSVVEVRDDWARIAAAFPFLDLAATLMDREEDALGASPVVTMLVRDGRVDLLPGDLAHHDRFPAGSVSRPTSRMAWECIYLSPAQREHGPIPDAWYDRWAQIGQSCMRQIQTRGEAAAHAEVSP